MDSDKMELANAETGTANQIGSLRKELSILRRLAIAFAISAILCLCFFWLAVLSSDHGSGSIELLVESPELQDANELAEDDAVAEAQLKEIFKIPAPKEEIILMSYNDFKNAYPLQETPGELDFIAEMLSIAQHNLATMSGEQTYYKRQSPFKFRGLDNDKYKEFTWSDIPLDLVEGMTKNSKNEYSEDQNIEGAVSLPGAELKKANMIGQWFNRLTKKEADFEIPNFPLDKQPDPKRVTHIDADLRQCTSGIKDQQACGACYAFSWISLLEWHHCRQANDGSKADFSEQHIVDCGHKAGLSGCIEGKLSYVKDFTRVFGVHYERDYPYKAWKSECKNGQGKLSLKVKEFKRIQRNREQFEQVLEEQPILLEVHLPRDINHYSSGIHPGNNCDPQFGHGMLLVGHGRQEGRPYWLLRNSLGKRWGENGYLRLSRDMPDMSACFRSAFVAKFKFEDLDEDKYVDFYDSLKFEPTIEEKTMKKPDMSELLMAGRA